MNREPNIGIQGIAAFLKRIKADERSSPSGMHWNDFFLFLREFKRSGEPDPPVPLILAASGESHASKHLRLQKQLEWASDHDCLEEAIDLLRNLSPDKWNSGHLDTWSKEYY